MSGAGKRVGSSGTLGEVVHVLKVVMKSRGDSETKAAGEMGVSVSAVNGWVNGRSLPNAYNCSRIQKYAAGSLRGERVRAPQFEGRWFIVPRTGKMGHWPESESAMVAAVSEANQHGKVCVRMANCNIRRFVHMSRLIAAGDDGREDGAAMELAADEIADGLEAMREQYRQNQALRHEVAELKREVARMDGANDELTEELARVRQVAQTALTTLTGKGLRQ